MQASRDTIYTVSRLNRQARMVLESEIGQVWVRAEISNFVAAGSGHWYFTLKDDRAQVRTAMFRNANRRVTLRPKEGDRVLVRATLSLYEPRGDYQLIAEHMEPEGEGLLKQQFEQLKQRLAAEGLFDQQHKHPIPHPIVKVGIITSATGAALHDILTVLKRRNPAIEVIIYPSQVQGDSAPAQLINALQLANQRNEVDVLILGRGGGSLEDLWCFNDEHLARAIFSSGLPVISAVGHEVDVSIADFVADLRAPTPSAAAELVSQDKQELENRLAQTIRRLHQAMNTQIKQLQGRQNLALEQLQRAHPKARLQQQNQHLDRLHSDLNHALARQLGHARENVTGLQTRLQQQSPQQKLQAMQQQLQYQWQSLNSHLRKNIRDKHQALANNSHLLNTVSPLATLSRGYSISLKDDQVVKTAKALKPGDELTTRFADGEVKSKVQP
ncbi:exodeoxyribonuclease VII large subunit [Lacimicrobium alkaliphilum]|uniref:Exodeoxyribonuclease 7 large subunit n=1 Tax=Lacimicrobium alkaliphilum TaxID=1526571 RepID=A0ABQ1R642_9ALTE|nr:exodeoxyribonuclease VII large subunit [Lacimicrobium alkaliphilum]GGD58493.1 exodeoxyribonuclease 7 large subunit [Lacimicrobium alkaliphilum]